MQKCKKNLFALSLFRSPNSKLNSTELNAILDRPANPTLTQNSKFKHETETIPFPWRVNDVMEWMQCLCVSRIGFETEPAVQLTRSKLFLSRGCPFQFQFVSLLHLTVLQLFL